MPQDPKTEKEAGKKTPNIHEGHRSRVKKRFLEHGADSFEPYQILELLLFYGIPQGDTNPLAHQLLNTFGSFAKVLDAPISELEKVKGIGPSSALLIKMIPNLARLYMEDLQSTHDRLYDTHSIGKFLTPKFIGRKNEVVVLLLLDSKGRVLYCKVMNEGSVREAPIYTGQILHLAVQYHAATAILAHNHPSGDTMVSEGDLRATEDVYLALDTVGVELADHFIIVDGDYLSMKEAGLMDILVEKLYTTP